MSAERPRLRALAERLGVVAAYHDLAGRLRETSDATREALCRAMGHEAGEEAAASRALDAIDARERERAVAPVQVWREHTGLAPALRVRLRQRERAETVRVELACEDGGVAGGESRLAPRADGGPLRVALPARPGPGRHRVRVWRDGDDAPAEQWLIVAPRRALDVEEKLGPGGRGFGVWANLYTLRSARNAGIGDLGDVAALARACGAWGGDFVGLSPLHAIPATGHAVSPYGPLSRIYRSPLALDVDAVPEWADAATARPDLDGRAARRTLDALRSATAVDYDAVRAWKLPRLRAAYGAFVRRSAATARARAYAAWREREGEALADFATWCALDAQVSPDAPGSDWRRWPEPYRDPASPAVARFRAERALEVDFHAWLQFELERQLGAAAGAARDAGLRVGLYADLAVGSLPGSADTWSFRQFAPGASVGAPPDAFAAGGQDWGVAPPDPWRIRDDGYAFLTHVLRAGLRHAGALRIDHVIGLQRLFWIPEGRPASEGAYVRYPLDDLLGVVALESRRAGALVVGEDLGTVSPDLPRALASWGILSSSVLLFEREADGAFRPAAELSARALASANTHDLAPLAGYFSGRDLALRRAAGDARAPADAERDVERTALVARLRADGAWRGERDPGPADWCRATSELLARSPAPLVAVSLDDLAGEAEPVHLPGIAADRHPSWRRRMAAPLEALARRREVREALPPGTFRRPRDPRRTEDPN